MEQPIGVPITASDLLRRTTDASRYLKVLRVPQPLTMLRSPPSPKTMTLDSPPASFKKMRSFGRIHTNYISALSFSPDGSLLASASADGTLGLFNVRHQNMLAQIEFGKSIHPTSVLWPEEDLLIVGRYDGGIQLLEVTDGVRFLKLSLSYLCS